MRTPAPATRLFPRQTRLIHAREGLRLRVVSGRLWLTQPNAAQDLFLHPGDCIDLLQDWVVIGADAEPRSAEQSQERYSAYELHPLVAPARPGAGFLAAKWVTAWLRLRLRLRLGLPMAAAFRSASTGAPAP